MKSYRRWEVELHSFLTSELNGDEWSASRSCCFILLERAFQPMVKVTKVTDQNFISEEFESKLNGAMTVKV
jgi:hypothetical protein